MRKQIFFMFLLTLIGLTTFAQERPDWIYVLPKPTNSTYYYVHVKGVGHTEKEVLNDATQDLNQQILDYLGPRIETKIEENGETIYQIIDGQKFKIKRWRVCVWPESPKISPEDGTMTQHYLYQVASRGNIDVEFDNFSDCEPGIDGMAVLKSALVPGLGQIHKGQNAKGACFLAGEAVSIAGIVVAQNMRHTYINKFNNTNNSNLKKAYADKANTFTTIRNISIGAAAAVYAWNVLDAVVSKNNHLGYLSYSSPMNLTPVVTDESIAFSLIINF